jgi:hypothetical protein
LPKKTTFGEISRFFPSLGKLISEGNVTAKPELGLLESHVKFRLYSHPCEMEFKFRGGDAAENALYAFDYKILDIDSLAAETIYQKLVSFYSDIYGRCAADYQTFEFFQEACQWKVDGIEISVVKNIYATDRAYVGWGRQNPSDYPRK